MAGQALSPWPSTPAALAAAIARLKAAVGGRTLDSDDAAAALGELASARVELEAPDAPQAARDESLLRFAGYLSQSDFGGITEETIGPRSVTYMTDHNAAWRRSGAQAILAPWKPLRGGRISEA